MAEEEKITAEETPETTETVEETAETAASEEISETDALKQEVESLKDKMIRHAAEFDNFKRRTAKEKTQIYTNAAADVVEAVLPFIDNMARATSAEVTSEDAKQLLEGIKLVERQFMETLKSLGVEEIKAVGEKFDPNLHNAVMHVDDEAVDGEEIVVEEFMKGYMYKDKVVRHSTVKVAN